MHTAPLARMLCAMLCQSRLLPMQGAGGSLPPAAELAAARTQQRSGNAIPVIAACGAGCSVSVLQQQLPSLFTPTDGFCMPLQLLLPAAAAVPASSGSTDSAAVSAAVGVLLQALTEGHAPESAVVTDSSPLEWDSSSSSSGIGSSAGAAGVTVRVPGGSALRRLLNVSKESMISEERQLLQKVAKLLEEVAPQVGEAMYAF